MDYQDKPPAIIENYEDPRAHKAAMLKKFLEKISQIESSGGKDLDHREMTHGMHKGTAAVGNYGLMPLTAKDQAGGELKGLSAKEIQTKLEADPELSKRLAETLASKLLNKNSEEKSAYKWLHGQYSNPSEEQLKKSDYVRKFKVLGN
jgi:hypothetical protein